MGRLGPPRLPPEAPRAPPAQERAPLALVGAPRLPEGAPRAQVGGAQWLATPVRRRVTRKVARPAELREAKRPERPRAAVLMHRVVPAPRGRPSRPHAWHAPLLPASNAFAPVAQNS